MNQSIVDLPAGRIREYERKAILFAQPEFLIPMRFVDLGGTDRVIYDYNGYVPVAATDRCLTVRELFDYLEELTGILRTCAAFLIFPERLTITAETVYTEREKHGIKLLFLPPEQETKPAEELLRFLSALQELQITREAHEYTETLKEYIRRNCALSELQNRISMMKREAFLCGIK